MEGRLAFGVMIGFAAVLVLSLVAWEAPDALSTGAQLAIAAGCGAQAGRLIVPGGERMRAHLSAMTCGALAVIGALLVTRWYLGGRASVDTFALVITNLVGCMPGALAGSLLHDKLRRPDEPIPRATVRER